MKKLLTLLLALTLVLALGAPALAADISVTGAVNPGTVVSYSKNTTFTVQIPADVTITSAGTGLGQFAVYDAVFPYAKALTVAITDAANYDDENGKFRLLNGTSNYIDYTMESDDYDYNSPTPVAIDEPFLMVADAVAGGASADIYLYFNASGTKAGSYTDTLTFTVALIDVQ